MRGAARGSAEANRTQPRLFDCIGLTCAWKPCSLACALLLYATMAIGRKWNWTLGYRTPAPLLMKPPDSQWFVAPSPFLNSNQRIAISVFERGFMTEYSVMGSRQAT